MPSPFTNLITELRRRRVFRVAAFYGGITFVIIQIIDGAFEYLRIPTWVGTTIIMLLLIGFPIAIILAWVFDITEEGIVRAKGRPSNASRKAVPLVGNKALASIALAAVLALAWSWFGGTGGSAQEPTLGPKSVAVLPFANLSDSKEDEYFSDGMTDDIITHLAKIGDLKVIARTSVMQYKNTQKRAREIARELGVAAVLEGSVRRAGDKVRIIGQLIDAETDQHLWAETYDRDLTDIFAIQSDVAGNIAEALKAILSPEEMQRLDERPTESTTAYDYYLRAIEYHRHGNERKTMEITIDLYQKALAIDSSFAQALAGVSRVHALMYWYGYDRTSQRLAMAGEAVEQALRLKPNDPVARVANGYYFYYGFRDYARALEEFYFAQRMEPGNGYHAQNIAYVQRRLGMFEEAVANLKTALDYDPHSSWLNSEMGTTYSALRRYDQAEQSFNRAIELAPDYSIPYDGMAWLQVDRTGNTENARQVLAEGKRLSDPNTFLQTLVHFDIEDNRYNNALERLAVIPEDVVEGRRGGLTPKEAYIGWIFELMEQPAEAHRHYRNAQVLLEKKVREDPNDERIHATLGKVYAHLGLADDAIRESRKAINLLPVSLDALDGPRYLENLAEVYTIVGEHDEALEILKHLLEIPNGTSIGSLKFRRVWDPLREHPRFQALLEKYGEQ
ncbi:MAG: tetratricopeptide repeat protein [Candidatus Neomarinimicrobiota bacterium]